MYLFDLLASPDQAQAAALLVNSLNYIRPTEHYIRALDSAPIRITLNNSTEPVDAKVIETLPDGTTADTITPQGTQKNNITIWLKSLSSNEKAAFGYYLNLPDIADTYKTETELRYNNGSEYLLYGTYDLSLTVEYNSTSLLQEILIELSAVTAANTRDQKRIAKAIEDLQSVDSLSTTRRGAKQNIHNILKAAEELRELSTDISSIRLEIDELLKIWEKKWSLSQAPGEKGDE